MNEQLLFLVFSGTLLTGFFLGFLVHKLRVLTRYTSKSELEKSYLPKSQYSLLVEQLNLSKQSEATLQQQVIELTASLATLRAQNVEWDKRLLEQSLEIKALQEKAKFEFEQISQAIMEEKSRKFTHQNEENLHRLLLPLKEHIAHFEANMQKKFQEEWIDRNTLKLEINALKALNLQISQDALNLTSALKGNSKFQGDWGEAQLETLLQQAGLEKNLHYLVQETKTNETGKKQRPDFIILLPNKKHLIIDAKVSLTAFERYHRVEEPKEKEKALQEHLFSVRKHIRTLGEKNYQQLDTLESPDYVLLFVPVEPAFSLALQTDVNLFQEALERNIVLVTTSTLLATLRTVSFIWNQEKQSRNVVEIARQSGLLVDKFVAFLDDLKDIADKLTRAQESVHAAMNKLSQSPKRAETLLGRVKYISQLGAGHSKSIPKEWIEDDPILPLE
jgi:DNA recombination protein RmuC